MNCLRKFIRETIVIEQQRHFQHAIESKYALAKINVSRGKTFIVYNVDSFYKFVEYCESQHYDFSDDFISSTFKILANNFKNYIEKNDHIVVASVGFEKSTRENETCNNANEITHAVSVPGSKMGIVAYESAMFYSKDGIYPDRTSITNAAKSIWKKYSERSDVDMKKLTDCSMQSDDYLNFSYSLKSKPMGLEQLEQNHTELCAKFKEEYLEDFLLDCSNTLFFSAKR